MCRQGIRGRPKRRQTPRTKMSIRVSERERREIEEKAMATSAYIRTMALDGGNALTYRKCFSKEKAVFVSAKSFAGGIAEAEMSFAGKL